MNKPVLTLLFATLLMSVFAQDKTVITIQADQGEHIINKNIYGHFAEHLGRCIYDGFYVGEDSPIPNKDGVRQDIIDALIALKVPVLRWPGGCFADTYHWMDGIGPKEDRPSMVNQWWGGYIEDNSFGTHDFLNLCENIGAEPYLAANVGSGLVKELSDWVQYVNHPGGSPMSDLRISNGRKEPWKVTYWGVGNEMWGCGGNMEPEFYANLYRQYATFMTDWSNSDGLFRIASGANEWDFNWTEVLMRDIPNHMIEGMALHNYAVIDWGAKRSDVDFNVDDYWLTMKNALDMEELVTRHSAIMDKYDPEKTIDLVVDEWGGWYDTPEGQSALYQQNTMRDAMIAGTTLNIFHNHADRVRMANLAQTVNVLQAVILTDEEKMLLTPTYHVMKMYNVHQDAVLLPNQISDMLFFESGDEKLPAISVSASSNEAGETHISLVNIHPEQAHDVSIMMDVKGKISGTILSSEKLQDYNSFEDPNAIGPQEFNGFKKSKEGINVKIPAFSVVVLKIK
jgi:alpha-N-arabinofuranosidase